MKDPRPRGKSQAAPLSYTPNSPSFAGALV
jgi:hypothetical protein